MIKKFLLILICGWLCISLTGCNKKETNFDEGKVVLNENIIEKIKKTALSTTSQNSLNILYATEIIEAANKRIETGNTIQGVKEFNDLVITSSDSDGNYTYNFYGDLYGVDDFNNVVSKDISISFYCQGNSDDCEVKYDGFSLSK